MDTKNLFHYIKNDISDISDIMNELSPEKRLSKLEIKLLQSRIRSLSEGFDMLENEIMQNGEVIQNAINIGKKDDIPRNPDIVSSENGKHSNSQESQRFTREHNENDSEQSVDTETVHTEEEINNSETTTEKQITNDMYSEPEPIETEASVRKEPVITTNSGQTKIHTIADKYNGASNSLHERIAAHIEQKDLASKLQQNPISDLTKAIKLNDKIWFTNELFQGDTAMYRETINSINRMETLDDALAFLELNFEFDQEKDSFKSFIEFIYRRFLK